MAAGLAASAKYPGVILVVPIVVAGLGAWRRVGVAVGLAVAAFVLTSPFVVIHAGAAWDDFHRVQELARDGWLGFEKDPATPVRLRPAALGDARPARARGRRSGSSSPCADASAPT